MECPFENGQQVVCIDDGPDTIIEIDPTFLIRKGKIYTIKSISPQKSYMYGAPPYIALQFEEIPYRDPGYMATRFAPLETRKTDISIFQEILNKVHNEKKILDNVK